MNDYADEIANMLKKQGIRAEVDLRNEKIGYKVREHSTKKVPFIFAIGNNEKAERSVSIRQIGSTDTSSMSLDEGIEFICGQNKV